MPLARRRDGAVRKICGMDPKPNAESMRIAVGILHRRHLARQFGKAIGTSFVADEPMKMISRSRTYVRHCVVAQVYLSHVPERPSEVMFRVTKEGEFSLRTGSGSRPTDCRPPES